MTEDNQIRIEVPPDMDIPKCLQEVDPRKFGKWYVEEVEIRHAGRWASLRRTVTLRCVPVIKT